MTARVFEQQVKQRHLLEVLGRGFVPMSVQFKDEIKESIADLDRHGFRDVTCSPEDLPAEVPAERKKARGRLVPALSELWNGMETGRVVIRRGIKDETLKMEPRLGDERAVWLVAGDIAEWPCEHAIRGAMVREGSRLTISIEGMGKSGDEQQHHFEWEPEEQRVLFRGEAVELTLHRPRPPAAEDSAGSSSPAGSDWEALTVTELQNIARDLGIPKADRMGKATLVQVIERKAAVAGSDWEALTVTELQNIGRDLGIPKADRMGKATLVQAIERKAAVKPVRDGRKVTLPRAGQTLEFVFNGRRHQIRLPKSTGQPATLRWGDGLKHSHPYTARVKGGAWKLQRGKGKGASGFELAATIDIEATSAGVDIRVAGSRTYHVRRVHEGTA